MHIFTAHTASTFTNNGGSKEGRGFGEGTWLWARVGVVMIQGAARSQSQPRPHRLSQHTQERCRYAPEI